MEVWNLWEKSDKGSEYIDKDYKLCVKEWDFKYHSKLSIISHYLNSYGQIKQSIQAI